MQTLNEYDQQDRGDLEAYARYLANMDAAMRQKIAATAAHLPAVGHVADMGMGSGSGSDALAALYPRLQVEGVDVNPTMVSLANQRFQRPNLAFRVGDIATACFPAGSLDGIVNSSVLHHVTSYNGYRYGEAARALEAQAGLLRLHGTLIVRDFLAPEPGLVELRLPPESWTLWERFASEFRTLHPPAERGLRFRQLGTDERGWVRLEVEHRYAVEFVLRKDYQQDWDTEILEEYTYFTQTEFEEEFRRLGLRVLISTPLHNPWIVENRFEGQFELWEGGQRLDYPPTNYLAVAEKVAPEQGVRFVCAGEAPTRGFLDLACYRDKQSGQVYDLVCRPHLTVDVLPYFLDSGGNLSVLVRHSYPRPIVTRLARGIDGFRPTGYSVEPITALQRDAPLGETVDWMLRERAGLSEEQILEMQEGGVLYPSPGGIREEVRCVYPRIEPVALQDAPAGLLPWSHSGQLRALDALQLIRSAQVNGLPDHRLEMHIFGLLRQLGRDPGPWLGDRLRSEDTGCTLPPACWSQPAQRAFVRVDVQHSPGFLQVRCHRYAEIGAGGQVLAEAALESVTTSGYSDQTVVALPMVYSGQAWWVGIQWMHRPAVQAFSGNSGVWVAPAWRLPRTIENLPQARTFVQERLDSEFGLEWKEQAALGGPYFPSSGITAELAYPWAVRVHGSPRGDLHFFPLEELIERWEQIRDGHLRCALLRAWLAHR